MRYFIFLQYDGTLYHGWQSQPGAVSVQETIEQKLSLLLQHELPIVGAGRTDAGVHARSMAAHFDIDTYLVSQQGGRVGIAPQEEGKDYQSLTQEELEHTISAGQWLTERLNRMLPPDILIDSIVPVRPEAHARYSPTARTYHYYISTHRQLFNRQYIHLMYKTLDIQAMNQAATMMLQYKDFTSFSKRHTDVKTFLCDIMEAEWEETKPGEYRFRIKANRFLRGMVRAIVGSLLQVGLHRISIADFCHIIECKDRCAAGEAVPGNALFLEEVDYPADIFYTA